MKLMLAMYRFLYAITLDRCWLLKCIDIINRKAKEDVINYLNSKEV